MQKYVVVPLNFDINRPNVNNRIYDSADLMEQFERMIGEKRLFVLQSLFEPDLEKAIGVVTHAELVCGDVTFMVRVTDRSMFPILEHAKVTTSGRGQLREREDGVTEVFDFELTHLALVRGDEF